MSNLSDKPWLVPGHMYQYDIGWLVDKLLSFETELNTAIDLKTIHYADPIKWDITTQYSPNTVVVDPKTGTAYMSKVPVPAGVLLTNTDYWVVIFNYQRIYDKIMSGVAFNDKDNLNATKDLLINDLVWYGGDLYRCIREIPKGTTYIPGTNLTTTTIEDCLATYYGRDRVAQVLNDTISVSGDYTLNARDITETASNVTIHSTQDMLLDADGNLTEQVTGGKTTEVGGKLTEHITGNREIDVDGDDSIHVDGVSSINRGGAVTEVYGNDRNVGVSGVNIEEYQNVMTENFNGKHIVNGTEEINKFSGNVTNIANKFSFNSTEKTLPINFPDKVIDLHNLMLDGKNTQLATKQLGRFFTKNEGAENPDYDYLQGCEYDSNGTIYCAFTNQKSYKDNAKICKIINYNIVDSIIINNGGHCNGLTVDDKYIYIASYSTSSGINNTIYKLNKTNLSIINSKRVVGVNTIYSIAYDKITKNIWCGGNGNYYKIKENETSWNVIDNFSKTVPDGVPQSFCVNNNKFYEVKTKPNILYTFNMDDPLLLYYIPDWIENLFWCGEVEDISFNNNNLQLGSISHLTQYSELNVIRFFETSFINPIEMRTILYNPSNNVLTLNVSVNNNTNPTGYSDNKFRYIGEAVSISNSPGFCNKKIRINVDAGDYECVTITGNDILIIGSNYKTQLFITYANNILINGAILTSLSSKVNGSELYCDLADVILTNVGFEPDETLTQYIYSNNSKITINSINTTNLYSPNSESSKGIFIYLLNSYLISTRYFKRVKTSTSNTSNIMYIQDSDIILDVNKSIPLFNMIGNDIDLTNYFSNFDSISFVIDNTNYNFKAVPNSDYIVAITRAVGNSLSTKFVTFTISNNRVSITNITTIGTDFNATLNEIYFYN